jgi:hypothetical protein
LHVPALGLEAAREAAKKKVQEIQFEPTNTQLGTPKEGKHDDKEHSGGNTYAGGVCATSFILVLSYLSHYKRQVGETLLGWVA